jgi:hypothetical protein
MVQILLCPIRCYASFRLSVAHKTPYKESWMLGGLFLPWFLSVLICLSVSSTCVFTTIMFVFFLGMVP